MIILDVCKISKNYGYKQLFEDVSFSLNEGESIAIVGPNGCGKSTILKIIYGIEDSDSGVVNIRKNAKVAYLDQMGSDIEDDRTIYDVLKDAFKEINIVEKKIKEYEKKLETDSSESTISKYCDLIEKFRLMGGYDTDNNINIVLNGLNISNDILDKKFNLLSGGEKTIIELARVLLIKPDLLLLDEPTNHLDIKRIEWLEEYIKSFKGASVIVSHDRYFLDKMVSNILAVDDYGIGRVYNTNYSGYLEQREIEYYKNLDKYENEQEAIKELEAKAKDFMTWGMYKNSSSLTKQGKTLWERAQRMRESAIKRPVEEKKIKVKFMEENKYSKKIITTNNLCVRVPNGKIILDNINIEISAMDRVFLLGENGSGKSTFIKTIMGNCDLDIDGDIFIGPSVKMGYIPQIIEFDNGNKTLLDYFIGEVNIEKQRCRSILARFNFNNVEVDKKIKNLSGGEKMRVKLAILLQKEVNTLIFDEPTNHIDIPTKEVLESAIEEFNGTLIFVSHDRFFINKFADRIIEFKDGKVYEYLGNYDNYKRNIDRK